MADPTAPAGIRWIEQTGPLEIRIHLTDGTSNSVSFPKPEPGPAGPKGQNGVDGKNSTVAGPRGPAGAVGVDGRDGVDGFDGVSVDTATIAPSGSLLIGLTSGEIINAGNTVGPAGASGERGLTGIPGPSGSDGTAFIAGERPPRDSEDGNDGDMWLDVSSPQFDLYGPKRSGAWGGRIAFLKQPPAQENRPMQSLPVGGGAGGGGSTAVPPFQVVMPASTEVQIAEVNGETTELWYKVTAGGDPTQWSAGTLNAASTSNIAGDEQFTIGAELTGVGGDLDVAWRVVRSVGLDRLLIFATSPVGATMEGRVYPYTDL